MTERCVILPALHGTNLESKSQDKRSTGKGGGKRKPVRCTYTSLSTYASLTLEKLTSKSMHRSASDGRRYESSHSEKKI